MLSFVPLSAIAQSRERVIPVTCAGPAFVSKQKPRHVHRAPFPRMAASSKSVTPGDEEDDLSSDEVARENSMNVYKYSSGRRLPPLGDELPFEVKVVSPPPHSLGQFMLNPRTGHGDIIEHNDKSYVVKRVICHYRLQLGGPEIFKKTIEVKSLARKSIESYLEKTFRES